MAVVPSSVMPFESTIGSSKALSSFWITTGVVVMTPSNFRPIVSETDMAQIEATRSKSMQKSTSQGAYMRSVKRRTSCGVILARLGVRGV